MRNIALKITKKWVDAPTPKALQDLPDAPATCPQQDIIYIPMEEIEKMEIVDDTERMKRLK